MEQRIVNSRSETIDYSFSAGDPGSRRDGWLVVLGHGVTGNKDRPVVSDTAAALNAAGFDTLRFSFSGNGDSGGDFREATISKEVDDLGAILDAVEPHYAKIAYIGHSMGAAVGVIRAARDPRIRCLVSLAGMVDTRAFAETEFGNETPDEGLMWDEADCPLSSAFMRDLCDTVRDVSPAAEAVKVPWLLVHGTADDVVLPKESDRILALKGDAVRLVKVEGADHSFNDPAHKRQMTGAVTAWLLEIAGQPARK